MRHLSPIAKTLISLGGGAVAAGLCVLNDFHAAATAAVATLFFVLFWTWLRD